MNDAQQQMVEYAKSKMNASSPLTPEQWCGKMIIEGVRGNDGKVSRATRNGKTIIITETETIEKLHGEEKITIEVVRINL
jgi:hypothetical protein